MSNIVSKDNEIINKDTTESIDTYHGCCKFVMIPLSLIYFSVYNYSKYTIGYHT